MQMRKSEEDKRAFSIDHKTYSQEFESLVKEHNKLSEQAEKIMGKQILPSSFENLQGCMIYFCQAFNS